MPKDSIFARLKRAVSFEAVSSNETRDIIYDAAADMISEAENNSLCGDLWEIFYAIALVEDENPICRTYERVPMSPGSSFEIVSHDIWAEHKIIAAVKQLVENDATYSNLKLLSHYAPTRGECARQARQAMEDVMGLAGNLAAAESPEDMMRFAGEFCSLHGSGAFALNHAFSWNSREKRLVPLSDLDPRPLNSLIGYDAQKKELLANTRSFLDGNPSNNVLLYGDSGTGKSSSVRALLNEPDFVRCGLRMIELKHGQFADINDVIGTVRRRNYRFVIFMDDLSFEEFEVEYKHLKALIEGGLERKPENIVVYATSNRRNVIREVWSDRAASIDDVHGWDTMQEKHSLADRFGVTIWYPSVGKDEYISMVKSIAAEMGLPMQDDALAATALRWELEKGGFTGRTARQFVHYMLRREA
ncbi:MAG: ATP-binding protein [Synergistaceae bacterium]|nr:ATP-binding protein [Synergistaceae bacterium]